MFNKLLDRWLTSINTKWDERIKLEDDFFIKEFATAKIATSLQAAIDEFDLELRKLDRKFEFDSISIVGNDGGYIQTGGSPDSWTEIMDRAINVSYITTQPANDSLKNYLSFKAKNNIDAKIDLRKIDALKIDEIINASEVESKWNTGFIQLQANKKDHHWIIFKNQEKPVGLWIETRHELNDPIATGARFIGIKNQSIDDSVVEFYVKTTKSYKIKSEKLILEIPVTKGEGVE